MISAIESAVKCHFLQPRRQLSIGAQFCTRLKTSSSWNNETLFENSDKLDRFCCCLFQTLSDSLLGPFSSHVFLFCGLVCTFLLIRLELVQQKCSKYCQISSQCRSSIFVLFSPALRQEHFVEACNGMHSGPLIFC